jgi:hypothetical protein
MHRRSASLSSVLFGEYAFRTMRAHQVRVYDHRRKNPRVESVRGRTRLGPTLRQSVRRSCRSGVSANTDFAVWVTCQPKFWRLTTCNNAALAPFARTPLRLRNEVQHGFKQVKWIAGIEFVNSFDDIGGGHGGYNQDHEFFGYHHSI